MSNNQIGVDQFNLTPAQIASLLLLGYSYYESGRDEEAKDIFEALQLLDPDNPYPPAVLGSIQQRQGKYEDAVSYLTTSLRIHPRNIDTLTNRGECYLNLGKFEEAAKDLKAAMALDPELGSPAANRARFLVALTAEGLKLASEQGLAAVREAKQRIDAQLSEL